MQTTPEDQGVHCLEVKQAAQEKIQQEIQGVSPEEEIAYYNREVATGSLGEWWRRVQEAQSRRTRGRGKAA